MATSKNMPKAPKTEAARKRAEMLDERRARQRYVDQPGQWVDTTPADVKKRREAGVKKFMEQFNKEQKAKKKK